MKLRNNPILFKGKRSLYIPLIGAKYHGGIRILFLIANYLTKKNIKVTIICFHKSWKPLYNLDNSISVKLLKANSLYQYLIKLYFYLIKVPRKNSSVLLSHWLTGFIYCFIPIIFRTKTLYFVQDSEEVFYPKKKIIGCILRNLTFFSYKFSTNNYVVTTKYGLNKLNKIVNKNSTISLIPLGVDKTVFYSEPLFKKEKIILFFPRKGWFKGLDLLIDVVDRILINNSLRNYKLILVTQERELYTSFPKSNRIEIITINFDDDLRHLYNRAEVLVHTSCYEGICLPILEAISCGTYVIATNSFGPLTYTSKFNSKILTTRSPNDLESEIVKFLLDGKMTLKKEEIESTVSTYTIENFLSKFHGTFNDLLSINI